MPSSRNQTKTSRRAAFTRLVLIGACALAAGAGQPGSPRSAKAEVLVRTEGPKDLLPLASALRNAWRAQLEDAEVSLGAGLSEKARLDALAGGAIDIALAGHGLDLRDVASRGMTASKVGVVVVVFAVHADVTVRDLGPSDFCDIFAGRVTNWSAYGGPDLSIKPVLRPETDPDTEVVRASIPCMRGLAAGPKVEMARTASDMRVALQSTSGAIGVTTMAAVKQSIVALRALSLASIPPVPENVLKGRYPLTRSVWLVTMTRPSLPASQFLAFAASDSGAAAFAEAGILPVRPEPSPDRSRP